MDSIEGRRGIRPELDENFLTVQNLSVGSIWVQLTYYRKSDSLGESKMISVDAGV